MPTDNQGVQYVDLEGQLWTYTAQANDYVPYVTATDIMVLQNPATSTNILKVTRITASGVATASTNMDIYLLIRTALNTGGTSTAVTAAKHDSNDPPPVGVTLTYSVAPTLNGVATQVRADRLMLINATTPSAGTFIAWEFGTRGGSKAIRLRPGQQLSINNSGNGIAAGTSMYIGIEWNESTPVQ